MSGSTGNSSKRRLPDQRPSSAKKKKQTHVALAQAFLLKDYGFRAPSGLRQCMSGPAPTRNVSSKKLICPANPNGRDPFQHLNDDEIQQIIGYLQPKDTEILRRVSKFWKATSEFHCGKSVLLQHLPWAASHDLDSWSNGEINLYYRRHCM